MKKILIFLASLPFLLNAQQWRKFNIVQVSDSSLCIGDTAWFDTNISPFNPGDSAFLTIHQVMSTCSNPGPVLRGYSFNDYSVAPTFTVTINSSTFSVKRLSFIMDYYKVYIWPYGFGQNYLSGGLSCFPINLDSCFVGIQSHQQHKEILRTEYYTINGIKQKAPCLGLNVVIRYYRDGTIERRKQFFVN